MPKQQKKIIVRVSTKRLKNGTKLRIYYYDKPQKVGKSNGKAQ